MSLVTSLGLFTTLPVPPTPTIDRAAAGRAIAWFPVTGAIVGAFGGLAAALPYAFGAPLLGSVLAAAAMAWVTGGLHLDGVADTADGLGSRRPPAEGLQIMKRSDIGPMGVTSLLFVVALSVASLTVAAQHLVWWAAALVPVLTAAVARLPILFVTLPSTPNARPGGFGSLFHGVTSQRRALGVCVATWLVVTALAFAALGWWGALSIGVAAVLALGVGWLWGRRLGRHFGGMTGDLYGSIIEVSSTTMLLATALLLAAA